jgi:hypothetical protein
MNLKVFHIHRPKPKHGARLPPSLQPPQAYQSATALVLPMGLFDAGRLPRDRCKQGLQFFFFRPRLAEIEILPAGFRKRRSRGGNIGFLLGRHGGIGLVGFGPRQIDQVGLKSYQCHEN